MPQLNWNRVPRCAEVSKWVLCYSGVHSRVDHRAERPQGAQAHRRCLRRSRKGHSCSKGGVGSERDCSRDRARKAPAAGLWARSGGLSQKLRVLSLQHGQSERLRRDHSEGIAANKALRQQLEASATAAEALRERLADRTRLRDSAVAQARSLQEATQALQTRLAAAEGVAAEVSSLKEQARDSSNGRVSTRDCAIF